MVAGTLTGWRVKKGGIEQCGGYMGVALVARL